MVGLTFGRNQKVQINIQWEWASHDLVQLTKIDCFHSLKLRLDFNHEGPSKKTLCIWFDFYLFLNLLLYIFLKCNQKLSSDTHSMCCVGGVNGKRFLHNHRIELLIGYCKCIFLFIIFVEKDNFEVNREHSSRRIEKSCLIIYQPFSYIETYLMIRARK